MAKAFVLSDESIRNSHGFYLDNKGGNMERFRENPVMLLGHDSTKVIGAWKDVRVEGSRIIAEPEFDEGDTLAVETRGKVERGYLKQLIEYAVKTLGVNSVDVNEQNEQAVGFYLHQGFHVISRDATDSTGKPYPVLHMQL